MSPSNNCPLCHRAFSILLWRHHCDTCKRTVCDDCAPKSSSGRKCQTCRSKVDRRKQSKATTVAATTTTVLNAEEERLKRVRAAEERMKASQLRGVPQNRPAQTVAPPATEPPTTLSCQGGGSEPAPSSASSPRVENTGDNSAENPMLAAALRRREQAQVGAFVSRGNSSEKAQLLSEIVATLHKRGEDEPFGLRSMDEGKLRAYLRHIKSKER